LSDRIVLKTFSLHDMTPVAGEVARRNQDKLAIPLSAR